MRREFIAILSVIIVTIGLISGVAIYEKYQKKNVFTVDLIARSPENGNWHPQEIHLRKGEKARLRIRNIETVTHGFAIPSLDIAVGEIRAGEVKVVEIPPTGQGRHTFLCTVWCSRHHLSMTGTIIVE